MEKENVLQLKNITKIFPGVRALDDVEFSLNKGEVMGLIGENGAGKSTLMNVLLGAHKPDGGEMTLKGEPFHPKSPNDALKKGISMIHQELTLVPSMSVAENIWLGREKKFQRYGFISIAKRRRATIELLTSMGLDLDPDAIVETLSVANMQLVEIMRAVSYNPDIIIMDEPTSALTDVEVDKLYKIIKIIKEKGASVIYISHKLEELFIACDRITVMRDGKHIYVGKTSELTQEKLVALMVGREMTQQFPKEDVPFGDVVFECKHLARKNSFDDISFKVRAGEILGFCGLIGAQRTEIMETIFGLVKPKSGEMYLHGKQVVNKTPEDAIKNGFAFVTEDRLRTGGIHNLSIKVNLSLAYLSKICKLGFVNSKQEQKDVQSMVDAMHIKLASVDNLLSSLSGGNQQKVIIGKWLLTEPDVFILDEPTRGIDVGSKAEIYKLIGELVKQGKAVILVSSELPELMGISDNIIVISHGKQIAQVERKDFNQDRLMSYAFGINDNGGSSYDGE